MCVFVGESKHTTTLPPLSSYTIRPPEDETMSLLMHRHVLSDPCGQFHTVSKGFVAHFQLYLILFVCQHYSVMVFHEGQIQIFF